MAKHWVADVGLGDDVRFVCGDFAKVHVVGDAQVMIVHIPPATIYGVATHRLGPTAGGHKRSRASCTQCSCTLDLVLREPDVHGTGLGLEVPTIFSEVHCHRGPVRKFEWLWTWVMESFPLLSTVMYLWLVIHLPEFHNTNIRVLVRPIHSSIDDARIGEGRMGCRSVTSARIPPLAANCKVRCIVHRFERRIPLAADWFLGGGAQPPEQPLVVVLKML